MHPTLVREAFHRDGWISEEKYDGWRMLAFKHGNHVQLVSRNGRDHTMRFADIARPYPGLSTSGRCHSRAPVGQPGPIRGGSVPTRERCARRNYATNHICCSASPMHPTAHVQRQGSGASGSEGRPRGRAPAVMIWITRSEGAHCDVCSKAIPVDQSQYEVVLDGRELRLDRECFQRRMQELK